MIFVVVANSGKAARQNVSGSANPPIEPASRPLPAPEGAQSNVTGAQGPAPAYLRANAWTNLPPLRQDRRAGTARPFPGVRSLGDGSMSEAEPAENAGPGSRFGAETRGAEPDAERGHGSEHG